MSCKKLNLSIRGRNALAITALDYFHREVISKKIDKLEKKEKRTEKDEKKLKSLKRDKNMIVSMVVETIT